MAVAESKRRCGTCARWQEKGYLYSPDTRARGVCQFPLPPWLAAFIESPFSERDEVFYNVTREDEKDCPCWEAIY